MDVFCDAHETMRRFEGYVVDLRRLLVFHGLACGEAQNFCDLGVKLEESRALRLDLPSLLRNIRDLEQDAITAEEMLTVVALASGGDELVEGRAGSTGLMRTVGLLQMMLAGVGTWAETGGAERAAQVMNAAGTSEERVSFEVALEELRLQLGEVKRRMRELEPLTSAGAELHEAGVGVAEDVPLENDRTIYAMAQQGVDPGARGFEEPMHRDSAMEGAAAESYGRETRGATAMAAAEREKAERDAAMEWAAERDAAEREVAQEDERRRTWPLEERVSPLPPRVSRMAAATKKVQGVGGGRQGMLQMGAIAAGLLLATVGIYDSLRSTTVRANKTVSTPASSAGAGAGAASDSSGAVPAETSGVAMRHDATTSAQATGADASVTAGAMTGGTQAAAQRAPREAVHQEVATADAPKVDVSKAAAVPVERKPATTEVVLKNRRDDAAVEAALLTKPRTGKYLYVPADVMDKHLLSSRQAVLPAQMADAQGPAKVVLNAFIAKDGTVSRTDVVEGPPQLINSAMAAVSWRRYRPFLLGGKPAEVVTPVTVRYGAGSR